MKAKRHNCILEVLETKNMTVKDLAKCLDRKEATVALWCANKTQPQLNTLAKIAEALGVDIRDLLVGTKD